MACVVVARSRCCNRMLQSWGGRWGCKEAGTQAGRWGSKFCQQSFDGLKVQRSCQGFAVLRYRVP